MLCNRMRKHKGEEEVCRWESFGICPIPCAEDHGVETRRTVHFMFWGNLRTPHQWMVHLVFLGMRTLHQPAPAVIACVQMEGYRIMDKNSSVNEFN